MTTRTTRTRSALLCILSALALAVPAGAITRRAGPAGLPALLTDAVRQAARSRVHVLRTGETLWKVGLLYGLSVKAIKDENAFAEPEDLPAGTAVRLPDVAPYALGQRAGEAAPALHAEMVKPADGAAATPCRERAASEAEEEEDSDEVVLPARRGHAASVHPAASGFVWPVEGGVISGFGKRRRKLHAGVDLKAPRGTPIRAARDGWVVYTGRVRGHGRVIVLEHDDGFHTLYAHNQKNLVGCEMGGERFVHAGEVIALVGCSGNASTPHVHFEIREDGRPVDPLAHLSAP
jgi:murein DD-endopeptidase MepM/ murein hydrolase activator NlpD